MSRRSLARRLLGVGPQEEVHRARNQNAVDRERLNVHTQEDVHRFAQEMRVRRGQPHFTFGSYSGGQPFCVPLGALAGAHSWTSGSTGAGKTRATLAWLSPLLGELIATSRFAVVCIGMAGDMCDLILRLLGGHLIRTPLARQRAVLAKLCVARPFQGTMPPWNILARSPYATLLTQAQTVAEILERSLGVSLGSRQTVALVMLLALAIALVLSLNELRLLLDHPSHLESLGKSVPETLVASYFSTRFAAEARGTLDGIANLLDRLLTLDDAVRGALAGPGTIDFLHCFSPGTVSCFDFSGSPLGGEGARQALGAMVIRSILAAGLSSSRTVSCPTIVVIDEAQLAFTPGTSAALADALTTIRGRSVGLHFLNQSLAQLERPFIQLLSTNITWRLVGRSGSTDASLSSEFLPRTGRAVKPRLPFAPPSERPEFLSRSEEEAFRVVECGQLPRGTFFVTERGAPFGVQRVEAPYIDPPSWSALPPDLRRALERGASGFNRTELTARGRQVETDLLARFERPEVEVPEDPAPTRRAARAARRSVPLTPDAVAHATRWKKKPGSRS